MSEQPVLISHPDGRRYSVPPDAFTELYEPQGFVIDGPETGAAFMGALGRAERPVRPRRRVKGRFIRETDHDAIDG